MVQVATVETDASPAGAQEGQQGALPLFPLLSMGSAHDSKTVASQEDGEGHPAGDPSNLSPQRAVVAKPI